MEVLRCLRFVPKMGVLLPILLLLCTRAIAAQSVDYPLDALTAQEYWAIHDTLQASGRVDTTTRYPSITLREPSKADMLNWQPGMWFCELKANKIARVLPSGRIAEFPIPTPDSWPVSIVVSSSGQVWFTELAAGKIGRMNPATGKFAEFEVPGGGYPGPIVRAADRTIWVATNAKRDAALGLTTTRSRLIQFKA